MKLNRVCIVSASLFSLAMFAAATGVGCNNVGDCPAPATILPGAACSGESLECSYTLPSESPACDGTSVEGGVQTSCVCTGGNWSCPQGVTCPAPMGEGGDDGSTDAAIDAAGE